MHGHLGREVVVNSLYHSTLCGPDTLLNSYHVLSHLILSITPPNLIISNSMTEETEAQRFYSASTSHGKYESQNSNVGRLSPESMSLRTHVSEEKDTCLKGKGIIM